MHIHLNWTESNYSRNAQQFIVDVTKWNFACKWNGNGSSLLRIPLHYSPYLNILMFSNHKRILTWSVNVYTEFSYANWWDAIDTFFQFPILFIKLSEISDSQCWVLSTICVRRKKSSIIMFKHSVNDQSVARCCFDVM